MQNLRALFICSLLVLLSSFTSAWPWPPFEGLVKRESICTLLPKSPNFCRSTSTKLNCQHRSPLPYLYPLPRRALPSRGLQQHQAQRQPLEAAAMLHLRPRVAASHNQAALQALRLLVTVRPLVAIFPGLSTRVCLQVVSRCKLLASYPAVSTTRSATG